jgi:3-oxoacyl-[acyl-carrier protein] reductase
MTDGGARGGQLAGRVVLVTGAARGMGYHHARLLAERGAKVVLQDIEAGVAAIGVAGDVSDEEDVERNVRAAEAEFGPVSILVNNAGIGKSGKTAETTEAIFDRVFDVNLLGSFLMARRVVPGMKAERYGKIVNISSRFGQVGAEYSIAYCASKSGVHGLTKAWAKEFAPWNICVNCVAPGGVWTEMGLEEHGGAEGIRRVEQTVPLKRWAQPEEIGYAVAFLASPESDFITGQVLPANGGATITGI